MTETVINKATNPVTNHGIDSNGKVAPMGAGTDASGNPASNTTLGDLISGEDQTNDVLKVEDQSGYTACAFAATPVVASSTVGSRLKGLICTVANTGGVIVYDNSAASGTVLYQVASLAQGDIITFPADIVVTIGITVSLVTDGTVVCLHD